MHRFDSKNIVIRWKEGKATLVEYFIRINDMAEKIVEDIHNESGQWLTMKCGNRGFSMMILPDLIVHLHTHAAGSVIQFGQCVIDDSMIPSEHWDVPLLLVEAVILAFEKVTPAMLRRIAEEALTQQSV